MAKFEHRPRVHADWEVNFLWTNLYVRDGRVETDDPECFDTLYLMGFEEVESFEDETPEVLQKVVPAPKEQESNEHFEAVVAQVLNEDTLQKVDESAAPADGTDEQPARVRKQDK